MTEAEENEESNAEPIPAPPTANPTRTQVPPEGPVGLAGEAEPAESGPIPSEEA